MESKVKAMLIKWGNNEESVKAMMEKHFEYAVNAFPNAKARYIADVVCTLK